jgi:hypothetical protein
MLGVVIQEGRRERKKRWPREARRWARCELTTGLLLELGESIPRMF